jgi:hypothetical protein
LTLLMQPKEWGESSVHRLLEYDVKCMSPYIEAAFGNFWCLSGNHLVTERH